MIRAVIERCAGIDVGKAMLAVCVMTGASDQEPALELRQYGTVVSELQRLSEWLAESGCTHVVMESTGWYWKPVFNILEEKFSIVLANPQEVRQRKGHKTDINDAQWLAHLLRHAMLRSSYIPPRPVRELRDLTRRRKQLVRSAVQEKNRIQKALEEGNVQLSNVLSDTAGTSGLLIIEALLNGCTDAREMAKLAVGRAKAKRLQIMAAIEQHRLSDTQRSLLRHSLLHLSFLEEEICQLDQEIQQNIGRNGWQRQMELLVSIPGVDQVTAASILAELGPDASAFPSAAQLSSWAGLCPGNNVSAGVSRQCRTTKGNVWLRATISQAAWAGSRTKGSVLHLKYHRLAGRRGKKRAIIAIAHTLLVIAYCVLTRSVPYRKRDEEAAKQQHHRRSIRYHTRCLAKLGVSPGSEPKPAVGTPPPPSKSRSRQLRQ
jgi:transposase